MFEARERSLGQLFADLGNELSSLVRNEIQLAKLELTEKAKTAGKDAALLIAGALVGYVAFLAMVTTVILLLAIALPAWLAALITTALLAIVGGALISKGLAAFRKLDIKPRQTVRTLQEDVAWAKQQTR